MANLIKLKKGLDIKLKGKAEFTYGKCTVSEEYALVPDDFHGILPKLSVREGDKVKAGSPVFFDKNNPKIVVVSPVSGVVKAVNRGERRKIMSIEITADKNSTDVVEFGKQDLSAMNKEQVIEVLLNSGLFAFIKQRPYDMVANPEVTPKAIFISCFDSAPLAPDYDFTMRGQDAEFQLGLDVLSKITKVHLGIRPNSDEKFKNAKGVEITAFEGPHPAGLVGVQINKVNPINKGETVWVVNPADVAIIGKFFQTGIVELKRTVVLAGSEVLFPEYFKTKYGVKISSIVNDNNVTTGENLRYINGNPLTGTITSKDGYLSASARQITIIPEGDETYELVGWMAPRFHEFSVSRTYFTWLQDIVFKDKTYRFDARLKGGERHMIASGEYDKVLPMDIYPEFLIKATLAFEVDKMEALGIYEVAPEDFALCEFVDSSKLSIQKIIREGLDRLYKELS